MKPRAQRPEIIANRIRQKRQVYRGAVFVIVEGDDDKKLFGRFFDLERCRIQPAYGRPSAEAALAILEADQVWGVLAIVDCDFDQLEHRSPASRNLLRTDSHDAETMMLASSALDHVLREHGDEDRIAEFEDQEGSDVRGHVLQLAGYFGYLRWYAHRQALALRFEDFPFEKVIHQRSWTLDQAGVLDIVQGRSGVGALDSDAIARAIEDLQARNPDPWHLCCGHDAVAILAIGLKGPLWRQDRQSRHRPELKRELLEKDLRLAYEPACFVQTALFAALRAWQKEHDVSILTY